jgi:hypothetical protein
MLKFSSLIESIRKNAFFYSAPILFDKLGVIEPGGFITFLNKHLRVKKE